MRTMQPYAMPDWVRNRILRRRATLFAHQYIPAARSALVSIDQRVERKWIAVQASGNPQRLRFD